VLPITMSTVTAVHEDVHHGTQQQNQERQAGDEMCTMFGQQEIQHGTDQPDRGKAVRR
jgi:hypothetical protein